jgi:uncharacterized protein (DUF1778 family)
MQKRVALLIRCSSQEAEQIRRAAKRERRTISGYVMNAVMSRITNQENLRHFFEERNKQKPPNQ